MVVPDICPRELEFGELTLSVRNDLIKAAYGEKIYLRSLDLGCNIIQNQRQRFYRGVELLFRIHKIVQCLPSKFSFGS